MTKILSLLALFAALSTVSAPAFAGEDELLAPSANEEEGFSPDAVRPPRDHTRRYFVCYARNITGRTFSAYGNWRTPSRFVQMRALQDCRRGSLPLIRRSCRALGCR